jgi:hypothetical protein
MKPLIENKMFVGFSIGMIMGISIAFAFQTSVLKSKPDLSAYGTPITNADGTAVTKSQWDAFDKYGTLMTNSEGIPVKTGHR